MWRSVLWGRFVISHQQWMWRMSHCAWIHAIRHFCLNLLYEAFHFYTLWFVSLLRGDPSRPSVGWWKCCGGDSVFWSYWVTGRTLWWLGWVCTTQLRETLHLLARKQTQAGPVAIWRPECWWADYVLASWNGPGACLLLNSLWHSEYLVHLVYIKQPLKNKLGIF